jgi:hypothetical protein
MNKKNGGLMCMNKKWFVGVLMMLTVMLMVSSVWGFKTWSWSGWNVSNTDGNITAQYVRANTYMCIGTDCITGWSIGNTTAQILAVVNGTSGVTGWNGSIIKNILCSQIIFDNGMGSSGICDGVDAAGAGGDMPTNNTVWLNWSHAGMDNDTIVRAGNASFLNNDSIIRNNNISWVISNYGNPSNATIDFPDAVGNNTYAILMNLSVTNNVTVGVGQCINVVGVASSMCFEADGDIRIE